MANELKTYGDLKSAIKSISLKQKGEKIAGVGYQTLPSIGRLENFAKVSLEIHRSQRRG